MTATCLPAPDAPLGPQFREPSEALSAFTVLRTAFFPDAPLGPPVRPYASTFSAVDALAPAFGLAPKRTRLTAASSASADPEP